MNRSDWNCPVPTNSSETITMSHGAGGRVSSKLFDEVFSKHYSSHELMARGDSAVLGWDTEDRIALSTDAFVVQPLWFPGGDIGSLSVYGSVNDLAVQGAEPIALTIAWVLEEGFSLNGLHALASSVGKAASECSVRIVAGDTKVVERGHGHGCYITTTGVGKVRRDLELGSNRIRPGDRILISGPIGDHGIAIMCQRAGLVMQPTLVSDCAPVHRMCMELVRKVIGLRVMRDPTRGGIAATLNELAAGCDLCFMIDESSVPIRPQVRSACELMGLDPWVVANEGKLIAVVSPEDCPLALDLLRSYSLGAQAACIGQVTEAYRSTVVARTIYGTQRIVPMPTGELLPRIC